MVSLVRSRLVLVVVGVMACGVAPSAGDLVVGQQPAKTEITTELLCEVCRAVVEIVGDALPSKFTVTDVYAEVSGVCDKPMRVYQFIPPKMADGCRVFVGGYPGDLEEDIYDALHVSVPETPHGVVCESICERGLPTGPELDRKSRAKGKAKARREGATGARPKVSRRKTKGKKKKAEL